MVDRLRSLVISHKLLGTREWFVIHHTNCGMELFTDDVMGDLLVDNLETAHFRWKGLVKPKARPWIKLRRICKMAHYWGPIFERPS